MVALRKLNNAKTAPPHTRGRLWCCSTADDQDDRGRLSFDDWRPALELDRDCPHSAGREAETEANSGSRADDRAFELVHAAPALSASGFIF